MHNKGRGRNGPSDNDAFEDRYKGTKGHFQVIAQEKGPGPAKSIEGWILFVSGIHAEAEEDNIYDLFSEFGRIMNLKVPLDRLTGYLKGYALVEYEDFEQAKKAIEGLNGTKLFERALTIDWAFKKGPESSGKR